MFKFYLPVTITTYNHISNIIIRTLYVSQVFKSDFFILDDFISLKAAKCVSNYIWIPINKFNISYIFSYKCNMPVIALLCVFIIIRFVKHVHKRFMVSINGKFVSLHNIPKMSNSFIDSKEFSIIYWIILLCVLNVLNKTQEVIYLYQYVLQEQY